ncbi:MAG: 16S rRNA (guanine(527)-N(7))-methyltransferase RsmG [Pseudomonadota bacterium]|nr:16S rRNA (guanine(527)-N(7))-methyltransferase RsmG [Pseudomonadota bacterium]
MNLPEALAGQIDVSRETMDRLTAYVALVEKWQQRVNLVSASTLPDIWMRHIWDSAQLALLVPAGTGRILDVGSGAGFPGLVLAALCDAELHLVESDQKKAVFLQTVIRETGVRAVVHNRRIESLPPIGADIVTARALASLDRLLELLEVQLVPGVRCLFLKGARAEVELATLDTRSDIIRRLHPSLTNPEAFVVDLTVTS